MKNIRRKILYLCVKFLKAIAFSVGNKAYNIFDPSNGGIGIRLNIARTRFIKTTVKDISINDEGKFIRGANLISIPKKIAIIILERGPAAATINSPHL